MTTVTPDDEPVTGSVPDCADLVCDPRAGAADSSTELPDAPAVNEPEVDVVGLPISVAAAASGGLDTADGLGSRAVNAPTTAPTAAPPGQRVRRPRDRSGVSRTPRRHDRSEA